MGWYKRLKLGLQIKKAKDILENEVKAGFDIKLALVKMGKNLLFVAGGVLVVHFSDPVNLAAVLGVLPENLQKVLAPLVAVAAMAIKNWHANRKNTVVMMVEVEKPKPNDRRNGPTPVAGAVPVAISVKPSELGPPAPSEPLTVTTKDAGA